MRLISRFRILPPWWTLRDTLQETLDVLDAEQEGPLRTQCAPELCAQARRLLADSTAAEPEFGAMLHRLAAWYSNIIDTWPIPTKSVLEPPLRVTLAELQTILDRCLGCRKVKTLRNAKRLPKPIDKRGRANVYLYAETVENSGWDDLPDEVQAQNILTSQSVDIG